MKFNAGDTATLSDDVGWGLKEFGGEVVTILGKEKSADKLYKVKVCLTGEIFSLWDYELIPSHVDIHVFW